MWLVGKRDGDGRHSEDGELKATGQTLFTSHMHILALHYKNQFQMSIMDLYSKNHEASLMH